MGDLVDTYTTNVKNNSYIHRNRRLIQFLRMKVYENNQNPIVVHFEKGDIPRTVDWAIYGKDSINVNDIERVAKSERRQLLLEKILASWWPIENNNIGKFTKVHCFKSIQIWIAMQRQIERFNVNTERRFGRQQHKQANRCQPQSNPNRPPNVKNLSVIPLCNHQRKHYPIDNYTLYKSICEFKIVKNKDGTSLTFNQFMANKNLYWIRIFYLRRIHRLVRAKKKFFFRILSNGVTVSVQFDSDKTDHQPLVATKETIVQKYRNGEIVNESGSDPGMNTWNATVRRNIQTGKEVGSFDHCTIFT